jgi:uncharacterized protein involved in type VI secretion and phage assembly
VSKQFGKHRGVVLNNVDPEQRGRLLVQVPDVLGQANSSWAMPSMSFAGPQLGTYTVPVVGAGVWVEFEGGDPDYPIWSGCFWGSSSEVPSQATAGLPSSPNVVVQTQAQNMLVLSDAPGTGGILLKSSSGAMIQINDTGITISNGKGAEIVMSGSTVTVNSGALVVS